MWLYFNKTEKQQRGPLDKAQRKPSCLTPVFYEVSFLLEHVVMKTRNCYFNADYTFNSWKNGSCIIIYAVSDAPWFWQQASEANFRTSWKTSDITSIDFLTLLNLYSWMVNCSFLYLGERCELWMCLSLEILFERSLVFIIYKTKMMQKLVLVSTFGCVVPSCYFSPISLKHFPEKSVQFVTCEDGADMIVLSLWIFKQHILDLKKKNPIEFHKSMD